MNNLNVRELRSKSSTGSKSKLDLPFSSESISELNDDEDWLHSSNLWVFPLMSDSAPAQVSCQDTMEESSMAQGKKEVKNGLKQRNSQQSLKSSQAAPFTLVTRKASVSLLDRIQSIWFLVIKTIQTLWISFYHSLDFKKKRVSKVQVRQWITRGSLCCSMIIVLLFYRQSSIDAHNMTKSQIIELIESTDTCLYQMVESLQLFPESKALVYGAHKAGTLSIGIEKRTEFKRKQEIAHNLDRLSSFLNDMSDILPELRSSMFFTLERIIHRFDHLSRILQQDESGCALLEMTVEDLNDRLAHVGILIQKSNTVSKTVLSLWRETYADLLLEQHVLESQETAEKNGPKKSLSSLFLHMLGKKTNKDQVTALNSRTMERELATLKHALSELEQSIHPLILSADISIKSLRSHIQTLGKRMAGLVPSKPNSNMIQDVEVLRGRVEKLKSNFEQIHPIFSKEQANSIQDS